MFARGIRRMSRRGLMATQRTQAITRHMMSTTAKEAADEAPVLFESIGPLRKYILNRPSKLNALDESMINSLRPYVEDWSRSELGKILVGTGIGRGFCAGGDVASIVENAANTETRSKAIEFFQREFELDYLLAAVRNPYVVVMDGITMGGGVGLSSHAAFRIATENTMFAMPETKIGYAPDVGGSHFLSRVDGELGTYLGLTGNIIKGRAVFEHGFATHFVPSRRIPAVLERLAALEEPSFALINDIIEECYSEPEPTESRSRYSGKIRIALDSAFRHDTVEKIVEDLKALSSSHEDADIRTWAQETVNELELRSPTSLKVALTAIRKGKSLTLLDAFQMELNFATAFCSGETPDFKTGVTAVLVTKTKGRPEWSPSTLAEVQDSDIIDRFFNKYTPALGTGPSITVSEEAVAQNTKISHPMRFALPTEEEIGKAVIGGHPTSGGSVITKAELLKRFDQSRNGKNGMKEKILEVLWRRTEEVEDKNSGLKYLKWKH